MDTVEPGGAGEVEGPDEIRAVGAVVRDASGRLLLVLRASDPGRGRWSIPGGKVEAGEDDATALAREVAEETGFSVVVGALLGSVRFALPGGGTVAVRDYSCTLDPPDQGDPAAGDDADDAAWVPPELLATLRTTDGLEDILRGWGAL